jgi:hypothetical protein
LSISITVIPNFTNSQSSSDFDFWSNDIRLTENNGESYKPNLAIDSKNIVHVVWEDSEPFYPNLKFEILYKKFDGKEWSEDIRLDLDSNGDSLNPSIIIDSKDQIHVIFIDSRRIDEHWEIYYTKFYNNLWTTPTRITVNSGISLHWMPQYEPKIICDSDDNLYVFWSGYKNYQLSNYRDIYYIKYDGNSWSRILDVTNDLRDEYDHFNPDVAIDSDDNIHLVYSTTHPSGSGGYYYEIHYRKFNGDTWSEEELINNNNSGGLPSITTDSDNNVHIIWSDDRNGKEFLSDIYYSKINNKGKLIIKDIRITNEPESALYADIITDKFNNLHIVRRNLNQNSTNKTLWYLKLDNNGKILRNYYLSTSHTPYLNYLTNPYIAIDDYQRLHVIFGDNRSGNSEIYYKYMNVNDLWTIYEDLQFSNPDPIEGDEISITSKIHNIGLGLIETEINVYLDYIDSKSIIGSKKMTISNNASKSVSFSWQTIQGLHKIILEIDPRDNIKESDEFNNIINKTIYVKPKPYPTIKIISPLNNSKIKNKVLIKTETTNTTKVEFYLNNSLEKIDFDYPFEWDFNTQYNLNGRYVLKVTALDENNNEAYHEIFIIIENPPDNLPPALISGPNITVEENLVTIHWVTNEPSKSNVEYGIYNFDEFQKSTIQYSIEHNITLLNLESGTKYRFIIISTDIYDNTGQSDIFEFVTLGKDNIDPMIKITNPSSDDILSGIVPIIINATDNYEILKIDIIIDSNLKTTLEESPFYWNLDTRNYSNEEHVLEVIAYDNELNTNSDEIIILIKNPNIKPSIIIEYPEEGDWLSGFVEITGQADDSDGDVTFIEIQISNSNWFKAEGRKNWIYLWDSSEVENGNQIISVRAFDGYNYSNIISVNVTITNKLDNNTPSQISLTDWDILTIFIILIVIIIIILLKIKINRDKKEKNLEVEVFEENNNK